MSIYNGPVLYPLKQIFRVCPAQCSCTPQYRAARRSPRKMIAASDIMLTLGCVWSVSRGHMPAPDVQHVDLWWQPAKSLAAAREACVSTQPCTGVYWNDADGVFKMLSGAVTSFAAPPQLRSSHSVHTHACSVDEFRRKLARSGDNVVFVVTTVPRTRAGAKKRDGTSYFSSHLRSTLSQARRETGDGTGEDVVRVTHQRNVAVLTRFTCQKYPRAFIPTSPNHTTPSSVSIYCYSRHGCPSFFLLEFVCYLSVSSLPAQQIRIVLGMMRPL